MIVAPLKSKSEAKAELNAARAASKEAARGTKADAPESATAE